MPMTRCLGGPTWNCNILIPVSDSRCSECDARVRAERHSQQQQLGPCPQGGLCFYCYEPAEAGGKGPFVWAHIGQRFIDGGTTVAPAHDYCNRGPARRHKPKA